MYRRLSLAILLCGFACAVHAQHQREDVVQRKDSPLESPAAPPAEAPAGYYAAPPAAGTHAGAANSFGIEGMAIHFPAVSLRFPSLELPCIFHTRRQPKVLLDSAQAPYVQQQQPVAVGAPVAVQAIAPSEAPPVEAPEPLEAPTQKDSFQKGYTHDESSREEIAELRQQVAALAISLERVARVVESAAQPQPALDRMTYNEAVHPGTLVVPARPQCLPADVLNGAADAYPGHVPSSARGTRPELRRLPSTEVR
jgi:hypothetical protein